MANVVFIRIAQKEDLPTLLALSTQLGYPVLQGEFAARLDRVLSLPDHTILVAETGGRVVGWVHGMLRYLLVEETQVFIGGLVVNEAHRNQRIGEKLMAAIEEWGRGLGAGEVCVYSNVIRERAHKFYERIGYESLKTSKVFKKKI